MVKENLYFIAILPNDEVCREIEIFKTDLATNFDSKRALKVVTHITLKTPFKLSSAKHAELVHWFKSLSFKTGAFQIELKNFGAFHNKYSPVIYVHPVMTIPLYELQKELIRNFRIQYPSTGVLDIELKFKPHITVAYRDLQPQKFKEAWAIYQTKKYHAVFDVNSFHLMQHDGTKWNLTQSAYL